MFKQLFIFSLLSIAIIGCSSGSSDNNADPVVSKQFAYLSTYPIDTQYRWYYNDSTTAVRFDNAPAIGGYQTFSRVHPTGAKEYFSTTASDLMYLGVYIPNATVVGNGTYSANVTFNEPLTYFSTQWSPGYQVTINGNGKVNISPTYGTHDMAYSADIYYSGIRQVTVPYGTFQAHYLDYNVVATTTVEGITISLPLHTQLWLVEGIGVVKRIENGVTFELTNTTGLATAMQFGSASGATVLDTPQVVALNGQPVSADQYSVDIEYLSNDSDWLSVNINSDNHYELAVTRSDLPLGNYSARVIVTSSLGVKSVILVSYEIQLPTLTAPNAINMSVGFSSLQSDATQQFVMDHNGVLLDWSISSEANWLSVQKVSNTLENGAVAEIAFLYDQVPLENQTYNTTVSVTYSTEQIEPVTLTIPVTVEVKVPAIEYSSPYLHYNGVSDSVTVRGRNLTGATNGVLRIGAVDVDSFTVKSDIEMQVQLPALANGEYQFILTNSTGDSLMGGRVVVIDKPVYADSIIPLTYAPTTMEYDPERQAIYIVFRDPADGKTRAQQLQLQNGSWVVAELNIDSPRSLTLTAHGEELLIATDSCAVIHVNPVTLETYQPYPAKANCSNAIFGLFRAFDDGQIMVADTNQWPTVMEYPGFTGISYPSIHTPISIISRNRNRMIYAESPTISGAFRRHIYYYDSNKDAFTQFDTVDPEAYYTVQLFAINADGSRFLHRQDVYDETMQYMGSLDLPAEITYTGNAPGVSPDGTTAYFFDNATETIGRYDLTGPTPPFPKIGDDIVLPENSASFIYRMLVSDDGKTAFIITGHRSTPLSAVDEYYFIVKNLQ